MVVRGFAIERILLLRSVELVVPDFSPLTPGTSRKKVHFLHILVIFRLDLGQITFNVVEKAFATQKLAFLATSIAF